MSSESPSHTPSSPGTESPTLASLSNFISDLPESDFYSLRFLKFIDCPAESLITQLHQHGDLKRLESTAIQSFFLSKLHSNASSYSTLNTPYRPPLDQARPPNTVSDWSAFYFQLTLSHALTYITQKYETSSKISLIVGRLVKVPNASASSHDQTKPSTYSSSPTTDDPIPPLSSRLIQIRHPYFSSPNVPGPLKASLLKSYFHLPPSSPLMTQLNSAVLILDNGETNYELILPHSYLASQATSDESCIAIGVEMCVLMELEANQCFETMRWRSIKRNTGEQTDQNQSDESSVIFGDWNRTSADERLNGEKLVDNTEFMTAFHQAMNDSGFSIKDTINKA